VSESLIPSQDEQPGRETLGYELAYGVLKRRQKKLLGLTVAPTVQVIRLDEGYAVELSPFFPDDTHPDGEARADDPGAARREALAFFRRIARAERHS
jgi:hypothetical protein